MSNTAQNTPPKVYFYYPGYNKKFVRRTLAGIVEDGKLYVAQAAVFPGFKASVIPVKFRNGETVFVVDPGIRPDHFCKKEGRRIATERVTGNYTSHSGTAYKAPKQTIIEIPVPTDPEIALNPGKFFVAIVENYLNKKGFPPREAKERKDAPEPKGV